MTLLRLLTRSATAALIVFLSSCGEKSPHKYAKYGSYELVGTYYDNTDEAKAKNNAADVLTRHGGEANLCLIGLWAYNPPAILSAARDAGKLGKAKIVGFDEHDNTLQGIKEGHIYATVVQQPFEFGYQSVKNMAELVREKSKASKPKVAFVSNNAHEFWTIAEAGTRKAATDLDVEVIFKRPQTGTASEQKVIIEDLLNQNVQSIAISVIDPQNQVEFLNGVAEKVPLITQDNDAPNSKRTYYIGTDNYTAGRAVGKLVKEVMPEGGKIAIFVGQADPLNARQREAGVLDELAGKTEASAGDAPSAAVKHVPHKVIKKDNVEEFHKNLRQLLGKE